MHLFPWVRLIASSEVPHYIKERLLHGERAVPHRVGSHGAELLDFVNAAAGAAEQYTLTLPQLAQPVAGRASHAEGRALGAAPEISADVRGQGLLNDPGLFTPGPDVELVERLELVYDRLRLLGQPTWA